MMVTAALRVEDAARFLHSNGRRSLAYFQILAKPKETREAYHYYYMPMQFFHTHDGRDNVLD
jgi:hypothetical protein